MENYNLVIESTAPLKSALIKLDKSANFHTLVVVQNEKVVGTLSDGDIRRGLIKGLTQSNSVNEFMTAPFVYLEKDKYDAVKITLIRTKKIIIVPVLNEDHSLYKILDFNKIKTILPIDAVIMAGGLGSRLMPLTKNTPKPMLKVGDKPIMDYNIDLLNSYGIDKITISVKYLKEIIIN